MPFVDGDSLRERITREHQLPVDSAVSIVREVADALDDLNLPPEAVHADGRGHFRMQHLDRDGAIVARVTGKKDGRHSAPPDLPIDDVVLREARAQQAQLAGHGPARSAAMPTCSTAASRRRIGHTR